MEENHNIENEVVESENSGKGKLIGMIFGAGAAAFTAGQMVGAKIGSPAAAFRKLKEKHKEKKKVKALKKAEKAQEKANKAIEALREKDPPAKEETPETETE